MIDDTKKPADWFLFRCPDGTQELMPPEGGEFKQIRCDDPTIHPLYEGGRVAGKRMSEVAKRGQAHDHH